MLHVEFMVRADWRGSPGGAPRSAVHFSVQQIGEKPLHASKSGKGVIHETIRGWRIYRRLYLQIQELFGLSLNQF